MSLSRIDPDRGEKEEDEKDNNLTGIWQKEPLLIVLYDVRGTTGTDPLRRSIGPCSGVTDG